MRRLCVRPSARPRFGVGRWVGADGFGPGCVLGQGGIEDGVGARFDQCLSLVENGSYLGIRHAMCMWDEASDEVWSFARGLILPDVWVRSMRWWRIAAMSSALLNPRAATSHGRRISRLWWLTSARRSSAVSGPNVSDSMALGLSVGESGVADEGGPAVVVGGCGDGLVGGEFGSGVLQYSVEHAACGRVRVVAGVWLGVVVGAVEGHVGVAGVPAAGHRDVEGFPGGGGFDEHMCGVGGGALGAVGGDRVPEVDVFGNVGGWEEDAAAEPASGLADGEGCRRRRRR